MQHIIFLIQQAKHSIKNNTNITDFNIINLIITDVYTRRNFIIVKPLRKGHAVSITRAD